MQTLIVVALALTAQFRCPEFLAEVRVAPGFGVEAFQPADPTKEIEFFSGEVIEITAERIEVSRSALGKTETRRFTITEETKLEGTPKKGSRVTVGYNEKAPEIATRVIVREGED
jgi:hypothetical protein